MKSLEEQLKILLKLFARQKIDYAILGGLAVMLYGEPRLTMDIDVNIFLSTDKIDSFLAAARRLGFFPIPSCIKAFIRRNGVIPMRFKKGEIAGRCDVIIAQNSLEVSAVRRARMRKFGSLKAKFISPEDLVLHKITSDRPRDREDLKGILMRQHGKLDLGYISLWLRKIAKANRKPEILTLYNSLMHHQRN